MVEDGHIRYSLLAIKNVGYAGYKAIVEEREKGLFLDIYDFMMRMENSHLSKKMLESLVDAGALDEFGMSRQTILKNLDAIRDYGHLKENLGIDEKPVLTIYQDQQEEKLAREKAVLGVYLSMHPIELMKQKIQTAYVNVADLDEYIQRQSMWLCSYNVLKILLIVKVRKCVLLKQWMKQVVWMVLSLLQVIKT